MATPKALRQFHPSQKCSRSYREQYLLQQSLSRQQAFLDSNLAAIRFSAVAIKSSLLLNGMGAVAVLYSPQIKLALLNCTLLLFAVGALLAVMAYAFAYLTQFRIMETWYQDLYLPPCPTQAEREKASQFIRKKRFWSRVWFPVAAFFLIVSWLAFGLGAWAGYAQLQKNRTMEIISPDTQNQPNQTAPLR